MDMRNSSRWKARLWKAQLPVAATLATLAFVLVPGVTPAVTSTAHVLGLGSSPTAGSRCFEPVTVLPPGPEPAKPPKRELDPRPAPPCHS
ncbi:MAG: hypothetical protein QOC83_3999 [Pseudonocardiales bacterium]|nr:hypothetical protein [Pseudonocardiales bacterium]